MLRIIFLPFALLVLVLVPSLFIYALIQRNTHRGKRILKSYVIVFVLVSFLISVNILSQKVVLSHDDFHGEYVINKNYFKGEQADWQYDHLRFEIFDNDSIYFYETEKDEIIHTFKGTIETRNYYESARLIIHMEQPTHHILESNPTIYRYPWSFNLVFLSPKFHNVYFRKKKWYEF